MLLQCIYHLTIGKDCSSEIDSMLVVLIGLKQLVNVHYSFFSSLKLLIPLSSTISLFIGLGKNYINIYGHILYIIIYNCI